MKLDAFLVLNALLVVAAPVLAGTVGELPLHAPDSSHERHQVPAVYTWDLSPLAVDVAAWEQEMAAAGADLEALAELRHDLGSAAGLERYLESYFALDERVNRLTQYANLARDAESKNQELIARHQRALALTNRLMEEGPALRQGVLAYSDEAMAEAFAERAGLLRFKPFIDAMRRRAWTILPPEGERVLSLAGDNLWAQIDLNELPSASESAFAALISEMPLPMVRDETGAEVQLSFANFGRLRGSADREVRKEAVGAMFDTLWGFQNTLAATLAGQARFDVFLARARGYDSALEAYLDKDEVDSSVYHNLVNSVRSRRASLHRYVELRRKLMGVEELGLYDLYVPMVAGVERQMSYAEGVDAILASLAPLGPAYLEMAAVALDPRNGWIDVYPSRDKTSGAFSASVYGRHPYLKMNFQNRYDDVSTLAHELGHALHSHLSMSHQSYQTWRYTPFLAEIASTCNEMLLARHMIDEAESRAEKAWLLSELAESIRTTIFRQTLFADFELQLHRLVEDGKPVTAEALNAIYGELVRSYYGPAYAMGEHDAVEWAYIPHFYWKYYVFNYATGLSSGIALAERLADGGPEEQQAYLEMLQGGSSRPPLEILKDAGVDLSEPAAIEAALDLFDRTLDQLEALAAEQ